MADPLLTSLCAICHISKPRYTCPRCSIKTCSLACTRKHKTWNSCSGVRDATTYVQSKQLRTPTGIDHDYNYLFRMESRIRSSEHDLIEGRGLLKKDELRPATVQEVKWSTGKDGRKRKVVLTRMLKDTGRQGLPKGLERRLTELGVRILHAPTGMQRQKENKTSYNRFQRVVNWTVEWLELRDDGEVLESITSRSRDDVPVYRCLYDWLDSAKAKDSDGKRWGDKNRGARYLHQIPWTQTWNAASEMIQEPGMGCWGFTATLHETGKWPSEVDAEKRDAYDYFLANPRQRADQPRKVTRLDIDDTLREVLRDTYVLEYPTIYILRKGATLPPGFVLAPKEYVAPQGTKRPGPSNKKSQPSKRRRTKDLEDGEVASDDDKSSVAGSAGTGGNDDEMVPAGALEVGDVVAEESFDEDEDGAVDDGGNDWSSETSSEGTSSEEEESSEEDGEVAE